MTKKMLRTFLTSYILQNWHRKNPGNPAKGVAKIRVVVSLARGAMGRAARMVGVATTRGPCRGHSAACQIGIVAALRQNGHSGGWTGRQALTIHLSWLASGGGIAAAEKRHWDHANCQRVTTKTALDGVTRLRGIMEGEGTALTALFYDGTAATMCGELTQHDAFGQFWMSIP